jgi:hypothetical protein
VLVPKDHVFHLSGFVLLSRPVFLKGRWRKLSVLISGPPPPDHIPTTQSVRTVWARQTSLNTAAWWSKPIDHPISWPINHLLSFALPHAPSHPSLFPHFLHSLSLSPFAFNPSLKSRSTKQPNQYHSRHQPKTVKYSTGCFKQVVLLRLIHVTMVGQDSSVGIVTRYGLDMQQYISLLSIVQSQPTRNHATGFSFKEPSSGLWKTTKNKLHAFCKRRTAPFFTITCTKCISIYKNVLPTKSVLCM